MLDLKEHGKSNHQRQHHSSHRDQLNDQSVPVEGGGLGINDGGRRLFGAAALVLLFLFRAFLRRLLNAVHQRGNGGLFLGLTVAVGPLFAGNILLLCRRAAFRGGSRLFLLLPGGGSLSGRTLLPLFRFGFFRRSGRTPGSVRGFFRWAAALPGWPGTLGALAGLSFPSFPLRSGRTPGFLRPLRAGTLGRSGFRWAAVLGLLPLLLCCIHKFPPN